MVFGFKNPFFSKKGQKERLSNVVGVFKTLIPGNKGTIRANTKSKVVNKALESTANHPFLTAGAVVGGATVVGRTAVKSVISKAGTSFAGASLKNQVLIGGGALIGVPALARSKKARNVLAQAPQVPGKLSKFGSDLGRAIEEPSKKNISNLITDNKLVAGIIAGAGALAVAPALISGAGGVIAGSQRNAQTKAIEELGKGSFQTSPIPTVPKQGDPSLVGVPVSGASSPISSTEVTGGESTPKTRTPAKRMKKKRASRRRSQSQNVKIINVNQSTG